MYNDTVMDHFQNPRNVGAMENPDGVAEVGSPQCGDMSRVYIKVKDNVITDISFQTFGCAAAVASSSMATEMFKGKAIEDALLITNRQVVEALGGLPEAKIHCSVMAEQAIRAAIDDYRAKADA